VKVIAEKMLPKSQREYGLFCTTRNQSRPSYWICATVLIAFSNHWNLVTSSDSEVSFETTTVEYDSIGTTPYIDVLPTEPPPVPNIRLSFVELGVIKEVISEEVDSTVVIPVDKYVLSDGQDVSTRVLRLDCSATFPVEWAYEGSGVSGMII